jgi:xylulokinase
MRDERLLVGVDVGTTAAKAGVFDADARPLAAAEAAYPILRPRPGWAEQDAELWWRTLVELLSRLGREADLGAVAAIGICSQVNTHLFVDAAGTALAPAILWQDQRCAEAAAELDARLDDGDRLAIWGGPFTIDASFLLARAAWFREHRAADWERVRWILSPKDYLNLRLSGAVATDPISPIGLVDAGGR